MILLGLMVVAEDKMEELSLRHWLEAEATRYSDDWLRPGTGAPAPSPRQFSSYWTEAGRLPAWLKPYQTPGFFEGTSWARRTNTSWWPAHLRVRGCSIWCSTTTPTTTWTPYEDKLHLVTRLIG